MRKLIFAAIALSVLAACGTANEEIKTDNSAVDSTAFEVEPVITPEPVNTTVDTVPTDTAK